MNKRTAAAVALTILALIKPAMAQSGVALVDDPFVHSYQGWVDAFPTTRAGNWRLSLHNPTLMDTNNANPPTSGATNDAGTYEPDVLIKDDFLAPASYEYTASMRSNDDDIIGLVWNYQDPSNYFRVGIRTQNAGSFGGTRGLAVQKIVGGVVTQLNPAGTGPGTSFPITQAMINNRTAFDLKVVVNGSNYDIQFNGASLASGSDSDLAVGRKIGFQSWAQLSDTDENPDPPFWGSEIDSLAVTAGGGAVLAQSFGTRPVQWRQVVMTNPAGNTATSASRGDLGNFGIGISDPWIYQNSNGFQNATLGNVDFIGPAVVVDEPGSSSFTDYQMRVRLGTNDNDGLGVLVRAQDDSNFYRITFANQATGTDGTRAPRGMSVQKVRNGVWTELYRDDQAPLFVYDFLAAVTPNALSLPMFDLLVDAVGNQLNIQVTDHLGNVIDYPTITDASDPLLSGTVGFHTWGQGDGGGAYFMGYGGQDGPLLVAIPEPSTLLLAAAGALAIAIRKRS